MPANATDNSGRKPNELALHVQSHMQPEATDLVTGDVVASFQEGTWTTPAFPKPNPRRAHWGGGGPGCIFKTRPCF